MKVVLLEPAPDGVRVFTDICLESINPRSLELYNKKQTVEEMERGISEIHKNGIKIHGMFVVGSDQDTIETIEATWRFARKNKIESVQFLILTEMGVEPTLSPNKL